MKRKYPNYIKDKYVPKDSHKRKDYILSLRYNVFYPSTDVTDIIISIFKAIRNGWMPGLKKSLEANKTKVNSTLPKENIFFTGSEENNKDYNDTPLHFACYYNHPEMVELLLQNGANVYAKSSDGQTPLYTLCFNHRIMNKGDDKKKINIAKQLIGSMNNPDQNQNIIQPFFEKLIQPDSDIRSIEEIVILFFPFFSDEQKKQLFNKACSDEYLPKIVNAILRQKILTTSDLTECLQKVKDTFFLTEPQRDEMKTKLIIARDIDVTFL